MAISIFFFFLIYFFASVLPWSKKSCIWQVYWLSIYQYAKNYQNFPSGLIAIAIFANLPRTDRQQTHMVITWHSSKVSLSISQFFFYGSCRQQTNMVITWHFSKVSLSISQFFYGSCNKIEYHMLRFCMALYGLKQLLIQRYSNGQIMLINEKKKETENRIH